MIEAFKTVRFQRRTMGMIHLANEIIERMNAAGYKLTLRQLYYQLVARDVIRNQMKEYKRLGSTINEARLAGFIDWDAIEDRTRSLRGVNHFVNPSHIIDTAAASFRLDKWANQPKRVEVWVEKDALVQVLEKACTPLDVDYFSCRGYTSQSEVYGASKRLLRYHEGGQQPVIIHLGDHDPSGMDMTRDIIDRLEIFLEPHGATLDVERIALNMPQVKRYNPPPNPAKNTDSRFKQYRAKHGSNCWELDALDPSIIDKLITDRIISHRDEEFWSVMLHRENRHRDALAHCANRWTAVETFLSKPPKTPRKPRRRKSKPKSK